MTSKVGAADARLVICHTPMLPSLRLTRSTRSAALPHLAACRSHVVTSGQTSVLDPTEARALLDSIDTATHAGLRDRALIGLMVYSFARICRPSRAAAPRGAGSACRHPRPPYRAQRQSAFKVSFKPQPSPQPRCGQYPQQRPSCSLTEPRQLSQPALRRPSNM